MHDAHHFRPVDVDQLQQLVLDALVTGRRDVVLRPGGNGQRQRGRFLIVVLVRFFDKGFVHAHIVAADRALRSGHFFTYHLAMRPFALPAAPA